MEITNLLGFVSLEWLPNPETNIAGYKIHYGTNSRDYFIRRTLGNVTHATVGEIIPGIVYYFAASAYDDKQAESDYSNEVQAKLSLLSDDPPPNIDPIQIYDLKYSIAVDPQDKIKYQYFSFRFAGFYNTLYRVEKSIDWAPWESVEEFLVLPYEIPQFPDSPFYRGVFFSYRLPSDSTGKIVLFRVTMLAP